jgi:hypothetical protein
MQVVFYACVAHEELIEFAAVVVDARGMWEVESFASLVASSRPHGGGAASVEGVTSEMLAGAREWLSFGLFFSPFDAVDKPRLARWRTVSRDF